VLESPTWPRWGGDCRLRPTDCSVTGLISGHRIRHNGGRRRRHEPALLQLGELCTAVLRMNWGAPVLLADVRDELGDPSWQSPGQLLAGLTGLVGGRDMMDGGTWMAVGRRTRRRGLSALNTGEAGWRPLDPGVRGRVPMQVAARRTSWGPRALRISSPFHLTERGAGMDVLWSWDGKRFTEQEL